MVLLIRHDSLCATQEMLARHAVLLTPAKSSRPAQLLSYKQTAPLTPLAATLIDIPASVANKRLTACVTPLDATLTENMGGVGGYG
jgi:hypothetical protein